MTVAIHFQNGKRCPGIARIICHDILYLQQVRTRRVLRFQTRKIVCQNHDRGNFFLKAFTNPCYSTCHEQPKKLHQSNLSCGHFLFQHRRCRDHFPGKSARFSGFMVGFVCFSDGYQKNTHQSRIFRDTTLLRTGYVVKKCLTSSSFRCRRRLFY
jgi:hypothetical protein